MENTVPKREKAGIDNKKPAEPSKVGEYVGIGMHAIGTVALYTGYLGIGILLLAILMEQVGFWAAVAIAVATGFLARFLGMHLATKNGIAPPTLTDKLLHAAKICS